MRQIFISAGHSNTKGRDRGAVSNGYVEGDLTVQLRSLIVEELNSMGLKPIVDSDDSILSQTINFFRSKVSPSCIVLDIHFNAGPPNAKGTETLIPKNSSSFERELAYQLSKDVSDTLGIPMRGNLNGFPGVKTELQSHHGSLGWMRLTGENVLMEVCFITNTQEMFNYIGNQRLLAYKIATTLKHFSLYGKIDYKQKDVIHTVREGDTLWGISRFYNVPVTTLKSLNVIENDRIVVGQQLKLK